MCYNKFHKVPALGVRKESHKLRVIREMRQKNELKFLIVHNTDTNKRVFFLDEMLNAIGSEVLQNNPLLKKELEECELLNQRPTIFYIKNYGKYHGLSQNYDYYDQVYKANSIYDTLLNIDFLDTDEWVIEMSVDDCPHCRVIDVDYMLNSPFHLEKNHVITLEYYRNPNSNWSINYLEFKSFELENANRKFLEKQKQEEEEEEHFCECDESEDLEEDLEENLEDIEDIEDGEEIFPIEND